MKRVIIVLLVILGARCSYNENLKNAEVYLSVGDCFHAKRSIEAALKKHPNDSKTLELSTQIEKCLNKIKYQTYMNNAKSMNSYALDSKLNEYKKALALDVNNAEALQLVSSIEDEIAEKKNQAQAVFKKIDSKDYWAALYAYLGISYYKESIQDIRTIFERLEARIPNMLDTIYGENSSSPIQYSIKQKIEELSLLKKVFPANPSIASFEERLSTSYEDRCEEIINKVTKNQDKAWRGLAYLLYREAIELY